MLGVGFAAGPMAWLVRSHLVPRPGGGSMQYLLMVAAAAAAVLLALVWWRRLAPWFRENFGVDGPRPARLATAAALVVGALPWLLLPDYGLPTSGVQYLFLDWLLLTVGFPLAALAVCPGLPHPRRFAAIAAVAALFIAWPSVSVGLLHSAADQKRASLGVPAGMLYLIDLPGYTVSSVSTAHGNVALAYDAPDESGVGAPGNDLVLTVCTAANQKACFEDDDLGLSQEFAGTCQATGSTTLCVDSYRDTTSVERIGSYFVSLTVNPDSQAPVAAADLPKIFRTLHLADDGEALSLASSLR